MNTPAYLFTEEFLVDNIYDSFINNTCKLVFLLKGPIECYKDTQVKACSITQMLSFLRNDVLASRLKTSCLLNTPQLMSYSATLTSTALDLWAYVAPPMIA